MCGGWRTDSRESKLKVGDAERMKEQKCACDVEYSAVATPERTWSHLTRSYSPLNIDPDVDVRMRQSGQKSTVEGVERNGD